MLRCVVLCCVVLWYVVLCYGVCCVVVCCVVLCCVVLCHVPCRAVPICVLYDANVCLFFVVQSVFPKCITCHLFVFVTFSGDALCGTICGQSDGILS